MNAHVNRLLPAAVLFAALTAAACGAAPTADPRPTASSPTTEVPTQDQPSDSPAVEPIVIDLTPGGETTDLDNGWTVQHCEGDAPLICVHDESGRTLGTFEVMDFPTTDAIEQATQDGTLIEALEAMVADQHTSIAEDRSLGCGTAYEYRPTPVTRASVGDEPAAVYAFSAVVDGVEVERHRAYYTVHDGQIWVLGAAASTADGCMADDIGQFTPADLAEFEPYLARIAAGLELP